MLGANRTLSVPWANCALRAVAVGCDECELLGAGLAQRLQTVDASLPALVAPCPSRIRILR